MSLKPEEIILFKVVIKDLLISVKNGTLYDFDHPIYLLSIRKLKDSIEEWFKIQKKFILGFSSNRILMNSELIESKDEFLFELARLLHARGILSVEFSQSVEVKELAEFVSHLKMETPGQDEEIETEDWTKGLPNIKISELDYRLLLTNKSSEYTTEEEEVWAKLFRMDLSLEDGLSKSNIELMLNFFNAPTESASFLNKIYHEALRKKTEKQVVDTFQQAVFNICEYFQGQSKPGEQKEFKVNLAKIVSRLHPDLISQLFESTVINGKNFDISRELLSDFTDQDVAEFIQSLVRQDGSINEFLLKIFQKMVTSNQDAQNVSPLVMDQLFSKHIINPQSFKRIQLSIKELFKDHPQNHFLNEMYKITVDALSDSSANTLKYSVRMGPLVNQFVKTYEEGFFGEEKAWVLLKTLSSEENYIDFQKIGERLLELFRVLLDKQDISVIRHLLTFYVSEIASPSERGDSPLNREKNALFNKMVHEDNLKIIINLIPEGSKGVLSHILQIMLITKSASAPLLIDTYLHTSSPPVRNKLLYIFSQMKSAIKSEVNRRINSSKPKEVRDLFKILQVCDPDKINLAARKMINQKDTSLLWDALEHFIPKTQEDTRQVIALFFKHDNPEIQKKAAVAILKSNNKLFIEDLFKRTNKTFISKKWLNNLIHWSREVKSEHVFQELDKVFQKEPGIFNKLNDNMRLNAFKNMCQIDTNRSIQSYKSMRISDNDPLAQKCQKIIAKYKKS
ncbi:hypothetical protein JW835_13875 [bacterium]|nr:hypothetical protein [bacterium]